MHTVYQTDIVNSGPLVNKVAEAPIVCTNRASAHDDVEAATRTPATGCVDLVPAALHRPNRFKG